MFLYAAILLVAIGFTLRALIRSFSPTATAKQRLTSNRVVLIVLLLFLVTLLGPALDSGGTSDLEWVIPVVIVAGLILAVPIWALVRTFRLQRTSAALEDVAHLTERIFALENRVKELQQTLETFRVSGAPAEAVAKPPIAPPLTVQPLPVEKPVETPPVAVVTPPVIAAEPLKPAAPPPAPRIEIPSAPPRRHQ